MRKLYSFVLFFALSSAALADQVTLSNGDRITGNIVDGAMSQAVGLPPLDPATDRVMLCGSPSMLNDTCGNLIQLVQLARY